MTEGAALAGHGESLICRRCGGESPGARPVSAATVAFWLRAGLESLPRLAEHPPERAVLDEAGEVLGRIRRHFLGHELRSLDVLHRTLGANALA